MSKALAIIDIDDELLKEYEDFAIECNLIATSKEDNSWRDSIRWIGAVKLKPMPGKKHVNEKFLDILSYASTCLGYNKCIDEILGKEE